MATALIKFTQGSSTDLAGRALIGDTASAVSVINGDNTGVATWKYEILDVPPGSAIPLTVQGPSSVQNSFVFGPPDVAGSYRIRLTVTDSLNNSDVDIRVFAVPFPTVGLIAPPYQGYPKSLPLIGSGAKPNEMNFGGQPYGWAGDSNTGRKLLYQALKILDTVGNGAGMTANDHAALHQLIHYVDEDGPFEFGTGMYREILPASDPFPTLVTWYTNSSKTQKILEEKFVYNGNKTIATITWDLYSTSGTLLYSYRDTITYSGIFELSRVRQLVGPS